MTGTRGTQISVLRRGEFSSSLKNPSIFGFRKLRRPNFHSALEAISSRLMPIAIRLEAISSRLMAISSRLEAIAGRLEPISSRLEASRRLEAIASRLEAIASRLEASRRLEAIASRLEAIASRLEASRRLEAIASRLEAIASRLEASRRLEAIASRLEAMCTLKPFNIFRIISSETVAQGGKHAANARGKGRRSKQAQKKLEMRRQYPQIQYPMHWFGE